MNNIILILGTQTQAFKAKRLLSSHGMRLSITKTTAKDSGCVYGLAVAEDALFDCALVLRQNQIPYTVDRNDIL